MEHQDQDRQVVVVVVAAAVVVVDLHDHKQGVHPLCVYVKFTDCNMLTINILH